MELPWHFDPLSANVNNSDIEISESFHLASKLSLASFQPESGDVPSHREHFLMSRGFLQYREATRVYLDDENDKAPQFRELARIRRSSRALGAPIGFSSACSLMNSALGITAISTDSQISIPQPLRAYPTSGGLSSIETYMICNRVVGIDQGVYHYNAVEKCLERIALLDDEQRVAEAVLYQEFATHASLIIVFVAFLDRLTPKYGNPRAFRLALLDAGHACQNVLLASASLGLAALPLQGYNDDKLASLVGADSLREIVAHVALVGGPNEI